MQRVTAVGIRPKANVWCNMHELKEYDLGFTHGATCIGRQDKTLRLLLCAKCISLQHKKPRGHFRVLLTHKAFKETTDLAKNQILQQASTAMLAQANASKQNVLSLLQG